MSKKIKSYNLSKDVIQAINDKANVDGRKDSDWLNRFLTMELITKTSLELKPIKTELVVAKPKARQFKAPTPLEVDSYFVERGINDPNEAQSFCDFYESKGWLVGKAKMKCWKAAVRNWLKGYKAKTKGTDILQLSADSKWEEGINEIF